MFSNGRSEIVEGMNKGMNKENGKYVCKNNLSFGISKTKIEDSNGIYIMKECFKFLMVFGGRIILTLGFNKLSVDFKIFKATTKREEKTIISRLVEEKYGIKQF